MSIVAGVTSSTTRAVEKTRYCNELLCSVMLLLLSRLDPWVPFWNPSPTKTLIFAWPHVG
jgi:hypothetical protein